MLLSKFNNSVVRKSLFSHAIKRFFYTSFLLLFTLASVQATKAESLNIVSDIKPVHSLVSMVLGDLGTSELIISRNVSPHDYSMRPSEVRMVNNSDIIFWTGPAILPSFEKLFEELPPDTQEISLLEEVEDLLLPIRNIGSFFEEEGHEEDGHDDDDDHEEGSENEEEGHEEDGHDDDDDHEEGSENEEEGHEEDGHDDDDDHEEGSENEEEGHEEDGHDDDDDHEEGSENEEEGHEEDGHDDDDDHDEKSKNRGHGHDHEHEGNFDAHAWLDPYVALRWIEIIAGVLISEDPGNKDNYLSNAEKAKVKIMELDHTIQDRLHDVKPAYIIYHDAFQYFETRFSLTPLGIISDHSNKEPGARHIRRLVERIAEEEVSCAFSEPVFEDDLLETVVSGAKINVYEIDPTGATIEPGPDLYFDLISNIADSFVKCASTG